MAKVMQTNMTLSTPNNLFQVVIIKTLPVLPLSGNVKSLETALTLKGFAMENQNSGKVIVALEKMN